MAVATGNRPGALAERLFNTIVRRAVATKMNEWIEKSRAVNIFVTGKTGTGKSSLVNGIVGRHVATEGGTLDPSTDKVTMYQCVVDDIEVNVWDSPGLQDGTNREPEYIEDIKRNCVKGDDTTAIDLFIYCIRMSETRFVKDNPDIRAMHILTDTLGMGMWSNTIFILSFANDVVDTGVEDLDLAGKELEDHFNKKLTNWTERLRQTLEHELMIPEYIAKGVKVIPAGYHKSPQLIEKSGDYWLSKLWMAALYTAKSEAQPALIKINEHRLKSAEEIGQASIEQELIIAQPIIFAEKGAEIGARHGVPQLGALEGFETGIEISVRLLLDLGMNNKFITYDDFVVENEDDSNPPDDSDQPDTEVTSNDSSTYNNANSVPDSKG